MKKQTHSSAQTLPRRLAGIAAESVFLSQGKSLFQRNAREWELPLGKIGKLQAGLYVILKDYAEGIFPPTFENQQAAYQAEIDYRTQKPGLSLESQAVLERRKPFWVGPFKSRYLNGYLSLAATLESLGILPPAKLLELGCGTGWMAEFLAITGYDVTGTSIAPSDIDDAQLRCASLDQRGIPTKLRFTIAAMESVAETVGPKDSYDAVFVFEALHHAFDWRETIRSSRECLKPGGWLLICNEPNILHTFISYRIAKISNTHEIGFSSREIRESLQHHGFSRIKRLGSSLHGGVKPHWFIAQKNG